VKFVAITLVLANLLYAVYWYLSPNTDGQAAVRGAVTVMPGRTLVLVDELSERDLIERLEQFEREKTASGTCWHYGPLTQDDAEKLLPRVQAAVPTALTLVNEVVVGSDQQVLVGPFDTNDAALIALPLIREFVDDSFVISIEGVNYISVGIFEIEANAEKKVREVQSISDKPVIKRELPRNQQQYWVVWDVLAVEAPADFFSDDFNELKLNGKLLKNPCEEVAQN